MQQEHDRCILVASRPVENLDSVYFNVMNGCHRGRALERTALITSSRLYLVWGLAGSPHSVATERHASVELQPQCQTQSS